MSKLKVNNIEPLSGSVVTVQGDINLEGTLTAREVRSELTQSIILFQSGSTKFGDTPDDSHQITGSLFASGNVDFKNDLTVEGYTMFKKDQFLTGSLFVSGARVEFDVAWPSADDEVHIIKTAPFTFNGGNTIRNYQYAAFNLDHFEGGNEDLHHSMRLYMYDSHDTPTYGSEIVLSPLDVKMQIIPSSSNGSGRTGKIEIRDEDNGNTIAAVNANRVYFGANFQDTQDIYLGNPSASLEVRSSDYTHFGDMKISGSIDNTYPSNKVRFFYPGVSDLPDPAVYHGMFAHVHETGKAYYSHQGGWVILAESASVSNDITALSSSTAAAIDTEKSRIDAILSASSADTDTFAEIVELINSVDTENDTVFAGYVTSSTARLDSIDLEIASLTASTSSYANQADLNLVTASVNSLIAETGSYALSSSLESEYLSIAELKAIITGSADFDAFKTAILAL
jgi:hypothetical protein